VRFKVQPIFLTVPGTSLTLPKERQHNRSRYSHVEDASHVVLPILATQEFLLLSRYIRSCHFSFGKTLQSSVRGLIAPDKLQPTGVTAVCGAITSFYFCTGGTGEPMWVAGPMTRVVYPLKITAARKKLCAISVTERQSCILISKDPAIVPHLR
jgi:hypothetical protein